MGHHELFTLGVLSSEELNDFGAVHTDGALFISPLVKDARDTEFTQAVFATDDVVAVPIPSCLDWFGANRRGSISQGSFPCQV